MKRNILLSKINQSIDINKKSTLQIVYTDYSPKRNTVIIVRNNNPKLRARKKTEKNKYYKKVLSP